MVIIPTGDLKAAVSSRESRSNSPRRFPARCLQIAPDQNSPEHRARGQRRVSGIHDKKQTQPRDRFSRGDNAWMIVRKTGPISVASSTERTDELQCAKHDTVP